MNLRLSEIAHMLNAPFYGVDSVVQAINTDSRKAVARSLFVALSGENFDGHDFVATASASGAIAALVQQAVEADIAQIVVPDTRIALAKIARHWRALHTPVCIGLTGSCGKTSVKEMIASILRQRGATLATRGNLNNDLGVPLTLLQLEPVHQYAVIEMGANHVGEIAWCAQVAQPDIALITMVAPAHLEGFGSIDAIATAKCEIYDALPASGCAVINVDDAYAEKFLSHAGERRVVRFGVNSVADISANNIRFDHRTCAEFTLASPLGEIQVQLPVPGAHNVMNALSAAACAYAAGASLNEIANGLHNTPVVSGRLIVSRGLHDVRLIDDTYNANLGSMKVALQFLSTHTGTRIAVLGDMGELGAEAVHLHQAVGEFARRMGIDKLFTLGQLSEHSAKAFGAGEHFHELADLLQRLQSELTGDTTILVKGSRSARMERVIEALSEQSFAQGDILTATLSQPLSSQSPAVSSVKPEAH